jgi:hypothetical protein
MGFEFKDNKGKIIPLPGITNVPKTEADVTWTIADELSKLKVDNMMLKQQLNDIKKILEDK